MIKGRLVFATTLIALILVACFPAGQTGGRAPEFRGITNWINSEPLTLAELKGKVVLVDFWTYTCVNCIRTMPYLRDWHAKYADKGLVIVGVHSPEFEFEKVVENVASAAQDFGLTYPIAQDNDFATWRAYNNQFWPAKYLVDQAGKIRYSHFGEGAYNETEARIRELLKKGGANLAGVAADTSPAPEYNRRVVSGDRSERITREIYGDYQRNSDFGGKYVAQNEYYKKADQIVVYEDPGDHENQSIYLHGPWVNGVESLRHGRQTSGYEDYIALKFFATSVNAVIEAHGAGPFEVQVTLDGRPIRPEEAGADLVVTDNRSFFWEEEGRMYEVVALPEFGGHELKLSSNSDRFGLFAMTFGAYSQGP